MDLNSRIERSSAANRVLLRAAIWVSVAAILAASATSAKEESEPTLPDDGAWARYEVEWNRLDNGEKSSRKVTLSFVGRVMEQTMACQWIEIKTIVPAGDADEGTYLSKYLVRQEDLLKSNNPLVDVIRAWSKFNDGAPHAPARTQRPDIGWGSLLLWTPGALKDATRSDGMKDVEYQKGRLKACFPRTGRLSLPVRDANGNVAITWSRKFTIWQHADLPIGFASAEVTDEVLGSDGKVRSEQSTVFILEDAGNGAKSELPDSN